MNNRTGNTYEANIHPTPNSAVLEEFRRDAINARVFDFDDPEQWDLVTPHLATPEVVAALDRGMHQMCVESPGDIKTWDPLKGPWRYTSSSYWHERIDEDLNASGWEPPFELTFDEDGILSEEIDAEYFEARAEAGKAFEPKPGTPDWYRVVHGNPFIAPWCAAVGRRVFPDLNWSVIQKDNGHYTAWGRCTEDPAGVLMDILFTRFASEEGRECTAREIVGAVLQEWGRFRGTEDTDPRVRRLGEAIAQIPHLGNCSDHSAGQPADDRVTLALSLSDLDTLWTLGRLLCSDKVIHSAQGAEESWTFRVVPNVLYLESTGKGDTALQHAELLADTVETFVTKGPDALDELMFARYRPN